MIADLELRLSAELSAESEDALREIVRFDEYASQSLGSTTELAPMSSILLRSESAASLQIEKPHRRYARPLCRADPQSETVGRVSREPLRSSAQDCRWHRGSTAQSCM